MKIRFLWLLLTLGGSSAYAAVTIGAGSRLNFADGKVDLGCTDLIVGGTGQGTAANVDAVANLTIVSGGTLSPGGSMFSLGGNFSDAGTFAPATSRVVIVDACGNGTSQVSGATSFYDLMVTTTSGKRLLLPAGIAQSVAHALTLQGAAGNLLQIVSSAAGQHALLNAAAGAAQTVAYVNARDNRANGATIAPGLAANYESVDGGNLLNWFANTVTAAGDASVPAPLLDVHGFMALLLALLIGARLARRSANFRPS